MSRGTLRSLGRAQPKGSAPFSSDCYWPLAGSFIGPTNLCAPRPKRASYFRANTLDTHLALTPLQMVKSGPVSGAVVGRRSSASASMVTDEILLSQTTKRTLARVVRPRGLKRDSGFRDAGGRGTNSPEFQSSAKWLSSWSSSWSSSSSSSSMFRCLPTTAPGRG